MLNVSLFLGHLGFLFWEFYLDLYPILIGLFSSLMSSFLSSSYVLDISPVSDVKLVKIFPHFVCCLSVLCLTEDFQLHGVPFIYFFSSVSALLVFCSVSCLLCQCTQDYSPLSLPSSSVYLFLCWGLWSTWTWVLWRVIDVDLFAFFYILNPVRLATFVEYAFFYCMFLVSSSKFKCP